jgi:hypothetical protein
MVVTSGDDAGNLTIGGGGIPPGTVVTNFGDGVYSYGAAGTVMSAGQTVTVAGAGGMVPPFGPEAVTAPPMIALTAPLGADGGAPSIPTSADLTVSWTGGQSGSTVTISMGGEDPLDTLTCTWDAALGQGTVPHALLGQLTVQGAGYMSYGQQTTTTFAAGAYTIAASAELQTGEAVTFE